MPVAAEKDIDVGVTVASRELVYADADELRTLIGNLAENAVRYTPAGGVVDLSVVRTGFQVVLTVRDTGPGIPEAAPRSGLRKIRANPRCGGGGERTRSADRAGDRRALRRAVTLRNRSDRSGLIASVSFTPASALRRGRLSGGRGNLGGDAGLVLGIRNWHTRRLRAAAAQPSAAHLVHEGM